MQRINEAVAGLMLAVPGEVRSSAAHALDGSALTQ